MSETVLTPANANPWYVLMTLYGEQTGEEVDLALHEKNRAAWNAWAVFAAPAVRDNAQVVIQDLPPPDHWYETGASIRSGFETEYQRRNPGKSVPSCPEPSSSEMIDMQGLDHATLLCMSQLFFPSRAYFNCSRFRRQVIAQNAWFDKPIKFTECDVDCGGTFQNSVANGVFDFSRSTLSNGLNLQAMRCTSLDLHNCKVRGDLSITEVNCTKLAQMSEIQPLGDATWNLLGYNFNASDWVFLNKTIVRGNLILSGSRFDSTLSAPDLRERLINGFGFAEMAV